MKSPTRDEIFKIYCEDNNAGDWHRPQENYQAGYRKGLKDAMQSQVQQSQWISVDERLPKARTTVLVVTNFDCIYTCRLPVIVAKNSALDLENGIRERFTHWMPLPLPPALMNEVNKPEGEKP